MISRVARTKEHWTETVPRRMKVTWHYTLPSPLKIKNRQHATKPLPCFRDIVMLFTIYRISKPLSVILKGNAYRYLHPLIY